MGSALVKTIIALLEVLNREGRVQGMSRLQRLCALVNIRAVRAGVEPPFKVRFKIYHLGPFSHELARLVELLEEGGLVEVEVSDGRVYYSVTEDGVEFLERYRNVLTYEQRKIIEKVMSEAASADTRLLILKVLEELGIGGRVSEFFGQPMEQLI